jgi:hypothetical protein
MNARWRRLADFVVMRYFTVDARTLGLFRICFGLHLICNLYDRTQGPDGLAFYTNEGVMPNHYALFAPAGDKIWSFLFAFSTPAEVQVAFCLIFAVYVLYVLGYRTKLAQILTVVCFLSLDNRNLHLQNGGIVVTNIVAIWTAFLPLGARFSVDHLLRSWKERVETAPDELGDRAGMVRSPPNFARLAFFGIVLNFAFIYFFNFAHKHGPTWRDGSAVHWVLWQNRIATIWTAWLRMHEPAWFSFAGTWATLVLEVGLPVWLLVPISPTWPRRIAIFSVFALHAMISLLMTLGPFSYSMMSFSLLLIGPEDWEIAKRLFRSKRPLVVAYDSESARHHDLARLLARLDGRRALAFVDTRALASSGLARAQQDEIAGRPFVVWRRQGAASSKVDGASADVALTEHLARATLMTGGAGASAVLSSLPFGPLYAWWPRLPPFRASVDRWLSTADSGAPLPALAFEKTPARKFEERVIRVAGEVLAAGFLATVLTQVAVDNWAIPDRYRIKNRPELQRQIVEYLRVPQGWSMFSPDAPKEDGTIVIDAVLSDGSHIDPRKQREPDFEAAFHGPWFDDQQWCDWDLRMHFDGNRHLHPHFRDYIARLDRLPSWKQHATIRYFDVYWVNNAAPPPGSTRPYNITKHLLFSGGTRP